MFTKTEHTRIIYEKECLHKYCCEKTIEGTNFLLLYTLGEIKISFPKEQKNQENLIAEKIKEIGALKNIKASVLSLEEKKLCAYYKCIFAENINFCREETILEVKTMLSILATFGLAIRDNRYNPLKEERLQNRMQELIPFMEVEEIDTNFLNTREKNVLKAVQIFLFPFIKQVGNKKQAFERICKVIKSYNGYIKTEETYPVKEFPNEVEEVSMLLRQIKKKVKIHKVDKKQ